MNYFKDKETFIKNFKNRVEMTYAIPFEKSNSYQQYVALGELVKEYIAHDWIENQQKVSDKRQVYYFFDGIFNGTHDHKQFNECWAL